MEALLLFIQEHHLCIVLKSQEHPYIEGYVIATNSLYVHLQEPNTECIHAVLLSTIFVVELSQCELTPGPCIMDLLPIDFPPLCWTCTPKPSPIIMEVIRLRQTMPPETYIGFSINEFDHIVLQLQDIYSINQLFTFICLPSATNPDLRIPLAIVNTKLAVLEINVYS